MFAKPPFTEKNLQKECEQTDQQADGISAIWSKVQPEWEIDSCSDNGLCDVVRQAHLAIKPQIAHQFAECPILIQNDEGCDKHQCKGKFLPHVESGFRQTAAQ